MREKNKWFTLGIMEQHRGVVRGYTTAWVLAKLPERSEHGTD